MGGAFSRSRRGSDQGTPACHAGFRDPSIGHCLCLPGWVGARCEVPYLPACLLDKRALAAPCEGFAGVMSCQCRRDCAALHANHGTHAARATDLPICWTSDAHDELRSSALPTNMSSVRFWSPIRLKNKMPEQLASSVSAAATTTPQFTAGPRGSAATLEHRARSVPIWGLGDLGDPRRMHRALLGAAERRRYAPPSSCIGACSHRGSCVVVAPRWLHRARAAGDLSQARARCVCHAGYKGDACEEREASACLHGCNGHGVCESRMCVCDGGWWGLDCSLSDGGGGEAAAGTTKQATLGRARKKPTKKLHRLRLPTHAPTYVLPLPTHWGMQHVYQGQQQPRRGMYEASRIFLERLHRRRQLVARPEDAVLFYVPVLLTQLHGCLWEPQRYLNALVHFLRTTPPFDFYWNRHDGADFVFFTTQDMGKCYLSPHIAARSMVVSHFGFRGGLADFMSMKRWGGVLEAKINASAALSIDDPLIRQRCKRSANDLGVLHRSAVHTASSAVGSSLGASSAPLPLGNGGEAAQRNYTRDRDDRRRVTVPRRAHLSYIAATWLWATDRWVGACHDRSRDVVAPPDFVLSSHEAALSRAAAKAAASADCSAPNQPPRVSDERSTLLFMSGSRRQNAPWYSQGVRQTVWSLLSNWSADASTDAPPSASMPGRSGGGRSGGGDGGGGGGGGGSGSGGRVVFQEGAWSVGTLRNATFCLCPSGWGFGWRTYLAVATLCVPVIVQPLVDQAYHDLLPYRQFALFVKLSQLPQLPRLLRAVSRRRVCRLRRAAARYYRALVWEEPDGLAYEMLQLSLCRRAAALRWRLHREGKAEAPGAWAACAHTTAEALLGL